MEKTKIDVKRTIEHHNKKAEIAIQLFIEGSGMIDPLICWMNAVKMTNFISAQADELKKDIDAALKKEAEELAGEL